MGSRIIYPAAITETGANNFSPAAALYDFTDVFASLLENQYVLLRSWAYYAPDSAAHDFSLWQAPVAAAAAVSTWIPITIVTGGTYAVGACPTEIRKASAVAPWVLLALTENGKDADGTVTISYSIETT
jgi:hypothetical protein